MKTEDVICPIRGTKFIVDVPGDRLIQQDNPSNFIPFGYMLDLGTRYRMAYDETIKNIPSLFEDTPSEMFTVEIPRLTDLAPQQMAEFYHLDIVDVIGKRDTDILFNTPEIKERLTLPFATYHIGDDAFRIDVGRYHLQAIHIPIKPAPVLRFVHMDYDKDLQAHIAYYDSAKWKLVKFDNRYLNSQKYPHIKRIEIPPLYLIDPIGVAIDMKEDPYLLLRG